QVGVPARTATRVSYATGRFVVTEESEGCGRLFVLDESGAELDVPGVPEPPPCQNPHHTPFAEGTLSPNGRLLAYVAQTWASEDFHPGVVASELVVVELDGGQELLREQVTSEGESRIISLDFDGDWVVMARTPAGEPLVANEVVGLSVSGARFLARVPGVSSVRLLQVPLEG
ncbi:MAG: hypothetical protein M3N51_05860, partial [Actinomycetota bacterium]|nr:hypothetical protein [Actinomycetota bacterium]